MKRRTKEIFENVGLGLMAMIVLLCGSFAKEIGQEGKAIFLIMCSLYTAMWVHAGIVATLINAKFEDKKEQTTQSGAADKAGEK